MVSNDHLKKYGFYLTKWKIVKYEHYNASKKT